MQETFCAIFRAFIHTVVYTLSYGFKRKSPRLKVVKGKPKKVTLAQAALAREGDDEGWLDVRGANVLVDRSSKVRLPGKAAVGMALTVEYENLRPGLHLVGSSCPWDHSGGAHSLFTCPFVTLF